MTQNHGAARKADHRAAASSLAKLQKNWASYSSQERGNRLKKLVIRGWSKRSLAEAIGCHESRVRQLITLAELDASEMAMPSSRESGDEQLIQEAGKRTADSQPELLAVKVPNEGQLVQDCARLTWSWVRKEIPEHCWRQFIVEIRNGPYSFRREEFLAEAPATRPCGPYADPDTVIEECRPQFNRPEYGPDLVNYCFTWFARWSQRVMIDPRIRDEAVALAERKIDQKIF